MLDIPRCEVCEFTKVHRKPTRGNRTRINIDTDESLITNDLTDISSLYVNHFKPRLKGENVHILWKTYVRPICGMLHIVDCMSGYVLIENQLAFSGSETIKAKQNYEK